MDAQFQQQLLKILQSVDRPGTFCVSGRLPAVLPGLEVTGLGSIALPLEKRQAAALRKQAHQAPYGKGTQTLVDTDVRRVWEIDAEQVVLANPEWVNVVEQAVGAAQSALGLEKQKLDAHLYKLLLYEPGSFFLAHRDGEKLDRMVATLVIALPAAHTGGELVVRHEGHEVVVDFGPDSKFHTQFAAFYADCEHEIRPVESGYRLALVYNLTLRNSKKRITAPTSGEAIAAVAGLLRQWSRRRPAAQKTSETEAPTKLAVLLDHKYTQAGLSRATLKGLDRGRADVLFAAAREAGFDASLALVTYWETGAGMPVGDDYGYGGRGGWYEDNYDDEEEVEEEEGEGEYVMEEVYDSDLTAVHFSDADGKPLAYGELPLGEGEIVARQEVDAGKPDREEFEGYTGNAGMTLERWYQHAAVLLWPARERFEVLCEGGAAAAVGGLEQMVRHWQEAGSGERESLKQACVDFARRIIAHWPEQLYGFGQPGRFGPGSEVQDEFEDEYDDEFEEAYDEDDEGPFEIGNGGQALDVPARPAPPHPLLALLGELGDATLLAEWISGVLAKDVNVEPGKTLGDLCKRHSWETFHDPLQALFEGTTNETLERQARLLADWALRKDKNAERRQLCARLAGLLVSAVERWEPEQARPNWQARVVNRRELLPPLVQALVALEEPKLLDRLATSVLARPKVFDLTTVQVPALLGLEPWLKRHLKQPSAPLVRWLTALVQQLDERAAHPPQEPTNWRRDATTGCTCADCQVLQRFLEDPKTETLRLPLAEARRRHLHNVIDQRKLDTTHVTERRGRPYTLVFKKTKASYERALEAHRVDLEQREGIRRMVGDHGKHGKRR
jgi:hypothetical protein